MSPAALAAAIADHDALMREEQESRAAAFYGVDGNPALTEEERNR